MLGNRLWLAAEFHAPSIEGLRHQGLSAQKQKMPRGILGHGVALSQRSGLQRSELADINHRRLAWTGGSRPVNKVFAIGQEPRPAMTVLASSNIELRGGFGRSARGWHAEQTLIGGWRKYDDAVLTPGASTPADGVANILRRSTVGIDFLQFASRKKGNLLTVRRPEGIDGVVSSGHSLRRQGVQRLHIQ